MMALSRIELADASRVMRRHEVGEITHVASAEPAFDGLRLRLEEFERRLHMWQITAKVEGYACTGLAVCKSISDYCASRKHTHTLT